jgi:dynein heavy chain
MAHGSKLILDVLKVDGAKMEQIQHSLDSMLATKRDDFGRFYFLSNDELLQILAEASTNPDCIQAHLRKIFENINRITLRNEECFGMTSAEGEEIPFKPFKLKGSGGQMKVESWLGSLLEAMRNSVRKFISVANELYETEMEKKNFKRVQWVMNKEIKA